jgi:hypothetical protein
MKEAYDEIARPLEPYVIVFIVFGIPACVMATDYCRDNSSAKTDAAVGVRSSRVISYKICDVACELALAFRSLATVMVYFASRQNRSQLLAVGTLGRRLRDRVTNMMWKTRRGKVEFNDIKQIRMIGKCKCRSTTAELGCESIVFTGLLTAPCRTPHRSQCKRQRLYRRETIRRQRGSRVNNTVPGMARPRVIRPHRALSTATCTVVETATSHKHTPPVDHQNSKCLATMVTVAESIASILNGLQCRRLHFRT